MPAADSIHHPADRRKSNAPALLGIDLGTSSVKAVVTDLTGGLLAQAAAEYPVSTPDAGWAETDPELWWSATIAAVRQAVGAAGGRIGSIGLSGQMHGVVPTDATGRPVRPAMLWADARAVDQLAGYRRLPAAVTARLANPLTPGMAGPLLAWLAANEPVSYRATRWALQPKDWIRGRLTGQFNSEPSDASATLLYDIPGDTWDLDVMAGLGLDPAMLPPMLPHAGALAGELLASTADQLGLEPGIPVAAGAADTAAAALGSGLTGPDQAQLTIGTGAQIVIPTAAVLRAATEPVTHLYRAATEKGWYEMAAVLNGGLTLNWVRQLLAASWSELYDSAAVSPRADDPIFLPHLHGERTPYMDTSLRGSWTGLDPRHDRGSLLRSALEGVAFTIRAALDALPVTGRVGHLRLAGGGSTAPAWRQMLADVLNIPLHAVHIPAASGRGAALLGARAAGYLDEPALLQALTPQSQPVADPQDAAASFYAERRKRFNQTLEALQFEKAGKKMSLTTETDTHR